MDLTFYTNYIYIYMHALAISMQVDARCAYVQIDQRRVQDGPNATDS